MSTDSTQTGLPTWLVTLADAAALLCAFLAGGLGVLNLDPVITGSLLLLLGGGGVFFGRLAGSRSAHAELEEERTIRKRVDRENVILRAQQESLQLEQSGTPAQTPPGYQPPF